MKKINYCIDCNKKIDYRSKRCGSCAHNGIKNSMYNNHHSKETKLKMSFDKSGEKHPMFGKHHSKETRKKISKASKGKPKSEEHRKKISLSKTGKNHPGYGKKYSIETRIKQSESQRGEKHWNWKGGISYEIYPQEWKDDLKDSIRKRDNYICQECGIHQDELNNGQIKKLDVHHIDYNKYNLNPDNLISLCRNCHIKTNYNRDYWINYFKEFLNNNK